MLALWLLPLIPAAWLLFQLIEVIRDQQPPGRHERGEHTIPAKALLAALRAETMRSYPGRTLVTNRG